MKPGFAAAFPTCRVYEEVRAVAGRADLHLEEQDPLDRSKKIFVAVLELKVLRSFSDTGLAYAASHSADAIEKGVKQAGGYKRERRYRVAALCCFDLRKEDLGEACFDTVSELATTFDVALRRWYLYASSELYRDATVVLERRSV